MADYGSWRSGPGCGRAGGPGEWVRAPDQAGSANLYRRNFGEPIENVAAPNEFHWMAGNFLKYAGGGHSAAEMPVDSDEFIALVEPRPIFIGTGDWNNRPACAVPGKAWVDARGMFMAAAAASPAWKFYGEEGLQTTTFPPRETFLSQGFSAAPLWAHPHAHWSYFITFASRFLK